MTTKDELDPEQKRTILNYLQSKQDLMAHACHAFDTIGEDIVGYMFEKGGKADIGFYSRQDFLQATSSLTKLKGMSEVLDRIAGARAIDTMGPNSGTMGFWLVFFFEGCDTPFCGVIGCRRITSRGGSA